MQRRRFLAALATIGACPFCIPGVLAAEGSHWTYSGQAGPDHWGDLDHANAACSIGSQQSPLDIRNSIRGSLPAIKPSWNEGGRMVNNGHTIQVNVPPGSKLARGSASYEMLQYHFHHPSEHLVDGKAFAMEAHFVHKNVATNELGVLGVLLVNGKANAAFTSLAAAFPAEEGAEVAVGTVDPRGLLPERLGYWFYEGSLTTPPCTENVDWMLAEAPLEVAASDIQRFSKLFPSNARPAMPAHRRLILSS